MAAFKRSGLHRLECDCGAYVYATVASLEAHGLPACPCGAGLVPARVELAMLLGVECDAVTEYHRELGRVQHGQSRVGRGNGRDYAPEPVALERVERRRRELARQRRVGALLPAPEALLF